MIKWILPLLWSSTVFAQSFSSGNEFTAYELRGSLFLTCYGPNNYVTVRKTCAKSTLLPVVRDYFETEQKLNGDRVRLKNISEKGNNYDRTVYYNKEEQRTHRRINLWAEYRGERGLLNIGENRIAFEFANKNKDLLLQGQVEIVVEDGGGRVCRDGQDVSYNYNDCFSSNNAREYCERYFEMGNYCD